MSYLVDYTCKPTYPDWAPPYPECHGKHPRDKALWKLEWFYMQNPNGSVWYYDNIPDCELIEYCDLCNVITKRWTEMELWGR